MPLEIHPFLNVGSFDPDDTVESEGSRFFVGDIAGAPVILAMTGIGMTNAEQTVVAALDAFGCEIAAVVFSGVAGSIHSVGEVAVPERWTEDGGQTWFPADPGLLDRARAAAGSAQLGRAVPLGDDACLCPGIDTSSTPIDLGFDPQVRVGGDGTSGDTLEGERMPCIPGGGDVFGCSACLEPGATTADIANFAANPPSLDFLQNFLQPPEQTTDTYASQDMESAAVARVAHLNGIPFVAVRGVSDGTNDPLDLPGFPFQFFAYRHLAANNAAKLVTTMLEDWPPVTQGPVENQPGMDGVGQGGSSGAELPASGGGHAAMAVLAFAAAALTQCRRRPSSPPFLARR